MQPRGPALPEFHFMGHNPVTTPEIRQGNLTRLEFLLQRFELVQKQGTGIDHLALL